MAPSTHFLWVRFLFLRHGKVMMNYQSFSRGGILCAATLLCAIACIDDANSVGRVNQVGGASVVSNASGGAMSSGGTASTGGVNSGGSSASTGGAVSSGGSVAPTGGHDSSGGSTAPPDASMGGTSVATGGSLGTGGASQPPACTGTLVLGGLPLLQTGFDPRAIANADIDGDGRPDLVTANYGSNTVSVFFGQGKGTFTTKRDFQAGTNPTAVALGDFNGDNKLDIVVADDWGTVSLLLGAGNRTFASTSSTDRAKVPCC